MAFLDTRIRTSRPEAQLLFDQGVLLAAGFNQPEAVASFKAALSYDPLCGMCWWGLAYARGPFQNKPAVPPPDNPAADAYPRYRISEMRAAVEAINIAAALTGLVRVTDADAAAAAAAASLRAAQPNGTAAAAVAGGSSGGNATVPTRYMDRLRRCKPSYGKPGRLAAEATGRHRRRMPEHGAAQANGTQNGTEPGAAASGAAPSEAASLLTRERHYVAAMADRLSVRAVWGPEWEAAEKRYAADMADIAACWPDDADAAALAAEALANTSPWDFWDPVTAEPREATPVVLALLNESLARQPLQPLALHLHIHVTEGLPAGRGSARAGLAEASADALLGLLPAFDHLQHMPSHTYVRVGRWADAVESNIASLRASVLGSHACLASLYPDHDTAMLVFAASMGADLQRAHVYARVLKELPRFIRDAPASLGFQWGAPLPVWVRFAQWKQVMSAPPPPSPGAAPVPWLPPHSAAAANASSGGGAAHLGGGDVAADPALDPVLQYPPGKGPARPDGGNSSSGGDVVTGPGPIRGPLDGTEYSADGAEYARVLWHFSRVMALAAQLAGAQAELAAANDTSAAGAVNGTAAAPPASPSPPGDPPRLSSTDLAAEALLAQDEARYKQRHGGALDPAAAAAALAAGRRALEAELAALRAAEAAVPPDVPAKPGQGLGIDVPGYQLLSVVLRLFAEARLALLDSRLEAAAEALGRAAEAEASGGYFEPPRLGPQPARQCLGWVLLRAGRLREALMAYLEDLGHFPDNPWSIRGLHTALPAAASRLQELRAALAGAQAANSTAAAAAGTDAAQAGTEAGAGGSASERVARLRGEVEALQAAVEAGTAADEAASGATRAAAGGLRSSCPAFSEHHK